MKSLSHVQPLATPWTAAYQAPPSMGFSRQEHWSGVPLPFLISVLSFTNYIDTFIWLLPRMQSLPFRTETLSPSALNSTLQVQNTFFVKVSKWKISTNLPLWIIYLYFLLFLSKFFTLFLLDHFPKLENKSKKFWLKNSYLKTLRSQTNKSPVVEMKVL